MKTFFLILLSITVFVYRLTICIVLPNNGDFSAANPRGVNFCAGWRQRSVGSVAEDGGSCGGVAVIIGIEPNRGRVFVASTVARFRSSAHGRPGVPPRRAVKPGRGPRPRRLPAPTRVSPSSSSRLFFGVLPASGRRRGSLLEVSVTMTVHSDSNSRSDSGARCCCSCCC